LDPQTDDDLGFDTYDDTDIFGLDAYDPNIMDYQTNDDLGFEDTLDTTDIFGPDVDLIQDPDTGYVRPMTVQELEQGAFDTRLSYAAPDNVLDPRILALLILVVSRLVPLLRALLRLTLRMCMITTTATLK
jgi:hypothetical protein